MASPTVTEPGTAPAPSTPQGISDRELGILIEEELSKTDTAETSATSITDNNVLAINYYKGLPRGDEVDGRSKVVSHDVADMVDALMAQIMPAFSGDNVGTFEPLGPNDESQAALESRVINDLIIDDPNGFLQFQQAVHDALLLKTGVIRVEAIEKKIARHRTLFDVDALTIDTVMAGANDETDIEELSREEKERVQLADGTEVQLFDVELRIRATVRELEVKAVPKENFRVHAAHPSIDLTDARFAAELDTEATQSSLIADGHDPAVIKELPKMDTVTNQRVRQARYFRGQIPNRDTSDPSLKPIETWRVYIRADRDGDGVAELNRVIYAGKQVIEVKPVDWIPYASGTAILAPYRFNGQSVFDKIANIQDQKTAFIRQAVDNVTSQNYPRNKVVRGAADMDALDNPRPGGNIIVKHPDAVEPLAVQNTTAEILSWMEYLDKMRSERGGASLDLQSAEAQLVGDTAAGIERQYQSRELKAQLMTKTLAETLFRGVFLLAHRTLRTQLPGDRMVQVDGNWLVTNPADWQPRERVNIGPGLSPAERLRKATALQLMLQFQLQLLQLGADGVLVNWGEIHQSIVNWGEVAGIDNPEKYIIDPNSPPAQQALQDKQQQAQQQQRQQMQLMDVTLTLQRDLEAAKIEIDRLKIAEDGRQADQDAAVKLAIAGAQTEKDILLAGLDQAEVTENAEETQSGAAGAA